MYRILLIIVCFFIETSVVADNEKAQKYLREAEYYTKNAEGHERDAAYYTKKQKAICVRQITIHGKKIQVEPELIQNGQMMHLRKQGLE